MNPKAAGEDRDTALIAAVQSNNDKMARILLDAGARSKRERRSMD